MDLKISGKVVEILEEQSGEGRNGPWRKRDFILETGGNYPKKVCMTQWGDQIDAHTLKEGETLTASVDIASREYNGRWYTDVKAWRIEAGDTSGSGQPVSSGSASTVSTASDASSSPSTSKAPSAENMEPLPGYDDMDDELPF